MSLMNKHPSDQSEELFRLKARRDQLLGLWAATRLGLSGREADAYARALALADLGENGEQRVLNKLSADFGQRASAVDEQVLRRHWQSFEEMAREQLRRERGRLGEA